MSTHDLREALETHAQFDDTAALARLGSVKHRVRVVRRRRRATLAGAAAAVVLAGSGLAVLLPGGLEVAPASRTFGDLTAPKTIGHLGYTFAFDRMEEGSQSAEVQLRTGDVPVLVTWAEAGDGQIEIERTLAGEDVRYTAPAGDFANNEILPAGFQGKFAVHGEGAVALAVYELTSSPDGAGSSGILFRSTIGTSDLVNGTTGAPGMSEISVQGAFQPAKGWARVSFSPACESAVAGAQFQVIVRDAVVLSGECRGREFDAGVPSNYSAAGALPLIGEGDAVMRLIGKDADLQDATQPALKDPKAILGLGIYVTREPSDEVLGQQLERLIEHDGHTWRLLASTDGPAGGLPLEMEIPSDDVVPVVIGNTGDIDQVVKLDLRLNGRQLNGVYVSGGQFSTTGDPITGESGSQLVLRLTASGRVQGTMGLAVYERVD
ncbi:hypothetical protein [Nocardioides cavernaquae]|uniref:Uncharacterized protein n=1 Tax=Nocardioides cavernaquae TaxID=2321396 RepID=A0A3A5H6U7_9ACTN|nr:hypothetical protein [Nocardioides cavernaquae]RJS45598.1 hypothetical protein D4739_04770 [Nocardioides cavernaquae]